MIRQDKCLKRLGLSLSLIGAAISLCGCISATGPLVDPKVAAVDPNLLGVWTATSEDGTTSAATFGRDDTKGVMTDDGVNFDAIKGTSSQQGRMRFVATTLNGHGYMSMLSDGPTTEANPTTLIARYDVKGDELEIRLGNEDVEKRLILSGRIIGSDDIADAASLAHYLENNTGDDLFPGGKDSVTRLHRIAPIGASGDALPAAGTNPCSADASAVATASRVRARITLLPWLGLAFLGGLFAGARFVKRK